MTDTDQRTDTDAIVDAARAAVPVRPADLDAGHVFVGRCAPGEALAVESVERYLDHPSRPRGVTVVHTPASFVDRVRRRVDWQESETATTGASVYADRVEGTVTAVLNDHDGPLAGWCDDRVTLALTPDRLWRHWVGRSGYWLPQVEFAEHLEEGLSAIVDPAPAVLLNVARTFNARRNLTYRSAVTLESGDLQLEYDEQTRASAGKPGAPIEIPTEVRLALPPWDGCDPVEVLARLRWDIRGDGSLRLSYVLMRAHEARLRAFDGITEQIRAGLGESVPLHYGAGPNTPEATGYAF